MKERKAVKPVVPKAARRFPSLFPAGTPPRSLLIFFSVPVLLTASAISGVAFSLNSPVYWISGTVIWIAWFVMMFIIVSPGTDKWLEPQKPWLNKGARVIFSIVFIAGILELLILGIFSYWYVQSGADNDFTRVLEEMQEAFQYNDGTALNQQATENLLAGKNPYANANVVETFLRFNGSFDRITPLRVGRFANVFPYPTDEQLNEVWETALQDPSKSPPEFESHVCYPAGSFLLPAPFIAAGLKDIRVIYFLLVLAGLIYAIWLIPQRNRLIFAGLAAISLEIWNVLAVGETGTIIFPFLLIAWITIGKNNWLSAIFMGIAVATKQTAWFFLPFWLILMWRSVNIRAATAAIGIIAGIFIVTNGYFIALDPKLWLASITSPVTDHLFPLGVGIITVVTSGLLDIRSSLLFSIMEVVLFIGCGIWYYFNCRKYPAAGPVLAVFPLFFAWRSLWTYFFYVTIIVFAMILLREEDKVLPIRDTLNSKL